MQAFRFKHHTTSKANLRFQFTLPHPTFLTRDQTTVNAIDQSINPLIDTGAGDGYDWRHTGLEALPHKKLKAADDRRRPPF